MRQRPVAPMDVLLFQADAAMEAGVGHRGGGPRPCCSGPCCWRLAAAIKLTSPGPVFFTQLRSGRGGKPFLIYKFRTMALDAEARKRDLLRLAIEQDGPAFKMQAIPA